MAAITGRACKQSLLAGLRFLHTGATGTLVKAFNQQDVQSFLQLTGDSNPIHSDAGAARLAGFAQGPIVPGMLLASMFPAIIGSTFPGAVYISQTLNFRSPAAVGHAVKATVQVTRQSGGRTTFATDIKDGTGTILVDGTALALIARDGPTCSQ